MVVRFGPGSALAPYVDMLWQTHMEHAGTFLSAAVASWELVFTTYQGRTTVVARGPETRATPADFPAGASYFGITFKVGTFMPHLPLVSLRDRQDAPLPAASRDTIWLNGSVWERPTFDNADVFVARLIRQSVLARDPTVAAVLGGRSTDLSPRTLQYRFVQATGLTYKTIQQIERARHAVALLEQGTPIVETAFELGYFDQAHLTNTLRRFTGATPAHIAQRGAVG